jgi:hypothetical protein
MLKKRIPEEDYPLTPVLIQVARNEGFSGKKN